MQQAKDGEPIEVPCLVNPRSDEVAAHLQQHQFVWIDFEAPTDEQLEQLGHQLNLHPLTIEDARTFSQRPKVEEYVGYVFMVVFGVDPEVESGQGLLREIHMILSGDYVVTIRQERFPPLTELRTRYATRKLRSEQFLVYKILDAVTDTFIPVLTRTDDQIDALEDTILDNPSAEDLQRIFGLKRDLVAMRRVVVPMRDMFQRNADLISAIPGLQADDRLYFRDLYDGLTRTSELVDSYRDLLSSTADLYLSTTANRQGEISKQLTIIATIFLPLTFLTGFFGQNFSFLVNHVITGLWSFLVFGIGGLLLALVGFWVYFRRKRWI